MHPALRHALHHWTTSLHASFSLINSGFRSMPLPNLQAPVWHCSPCLGRMKAAAWAQHSIQWGCQGAWHTLLGFPMGSALMRHRGTAHVVDGADQVHRRGIHGRCTGGYPGTLRTLHGAGPSARHTVHGRAVLKKFATPTETNLQGDALCFMVKTWATHMTTEALLNPGWLAAVGGWWRLAVGGWRRLAVGDWWRLAVVGG